MPISRYERPVTVAGACELLKLQAGAVSVLAGGTDLLADIRAGRQVDTVVDIKRIPELGEITWADDGGVSIGACVVMRRIAEDARIAERFPALSQAANQLASYQVRCRATIAGNLSNASPCADNAPPLLVFNARVRIASTQGVREMWLNSFIVNVKKTALKQDEIVTTIIIPAPPARLRSGFLKVKRTRGHDMALVNAAASFDPDTCEFRLAIGSAACTPVLVEGLEGICPPGTSAEEAGARLAEKALACITPIDDVRASAKYRREMTAVLCRRLAAKLMSEEEGGAR